MTPLQQPIQMTLDTQRDSTTTAATDDASHRDRPPPPPPRTPIEVPVDGRPPADVAGQVCEAAALTAGAGDFGAPVSRNRFTRSSSNLGDVLEEEAVGENRSGSGSGNVMSPSPSGSSSGIRRSRRFFEHHGIYPTCSINTGTDVYRSGSGCTVLTSADSGPVGPPITFNPPNSDWQRLQAQIFRITVYETHRPLPDAPPRTFPPNCPPRRCRQVAGDGNCLFRAISYWITGSEDFHMEVRQGIVDELRMNARHYSAVTQEQDDAPIDYLEESRIAHEGVWGSDVEILVAATMLRTPIAVFSAFGDRQHLWQVFEPMDRTGEGPPAAGAEGGAAAGATAADTLNEDGRVMIYLQNYSNHFEPVTDI